MLLNLSPAYQPSISLSTTLIVAITLILLDFNKTDGLTTVSPTTITTSTLCAPQFPKVCICGRKMYAGKVQYVVNCTNAGLRNTNILEFMPEEVQVLIFTGNYIPELPWNVFGAINDYKNLKTVDMSNNHIREIRGKSYHHVQNVELLILNHNNLSISRYDNEMNHHHPRVFSNFINLISLHLTNAFDDNNSPQFSEDLHDIFMNSQLTKLQKLHLEQNEISTFKDNRLFCDLPSLTDLHLGDNRLNDINFEIQCLKNLRFLDLERNRFDYIKTHDLISMNNLQERLDRTTNLIVDFNLNPFVCDCRISPFRMWIKTTNVTVRRKESLMCYRNQTETLPIMELDMQTCTSTDTMNSHSLSLLMNDMIDDESNTSSALIRHTALLIFLLIVLSMILIALVLALLYISRDKLKVLVNPVFDSVAKKVQYTTIKDEECPEVNV